MKRLKIAVIMTPVAGVWSVRRSLVTDHTNRVLVAMQTDIARNGVQLYPLADIPSYADVRIHWAYKEHSDEPINYT